MRGHRHYSSSLERKMVMIKPIGRVQGASQAPQPQRVKTEGGRKLTGVWS